MDILPSIEQQMLIHLKLFVNLYNNYTDMQKISKVVGLVTCIIHKHFAQPFL